MLGKTDKARGILSGRWLEELVTGTRKRKEPPDESEKAGEGRRVLTRMHQFLHIEKAGRRKLG